MTSNEIRDFQAQQFAAGKQNDPLGYTLAEIALQLALFNEHQERMEKRRLMEMTALAMKNKSAVRSKPSAVYQTVATKPATVKFKTKAGSVLSLKAIKTFVKGQKAKGPATHNS